MKIKKEESKTILYIPKIDKENNLENIDNLETYFRKLFIKLKKIYNIKLAGYYNITIYLNDIYGTIVELAKEEIKYSYLNDKIDMQIEILENSEILYKINDYYKSKDIITYKLDSDIYIKPLNITNINLSKLIEHSTIIYGESLDKIKYKLKQI